MAINHAAAAACAMLFSACGDGLPSVAVSHAQEPRFDSIAVNAYRIDLDKDVLRLYWQDTDGRDYRSGSALAENLDKQSERLVLAMNSGIYREAGHGLTPQGLHIEKGKELVPLDLLESGEGNFYLQPNGVLWWGGGHAGLMTTQDYANSSLSPEYALQSGPLLVMDGKINPSIEDARKVRYTRAGAGITADGTVVLAFSAEPLSLYEFAAVFRDELNCPNALYLDGAIVSLHIPGANIHHSGGPMAGILALVEAAE